MSCTVCDKPVDDPAAYACTSCTTTARRHLDDIADATPAARDVAAGLARRGPAAAGGSTTGRIPLNLHARARLQAVDNEIATWARSIAHERGQQIPQPDRRPVAGPGCPAGWCDHGSCRAIREHVDEDPTATAARWLTGQLHWLRHRPYVDEAYRDFRAAAGIIRGIAAGPTDRRWLGQCGNVLDDDTRCPADLHARVDARVATCRACGARHDVAARRAFLDGQVADQAYTARQISLAYPHVPEGTIRSWAARGEIAAELEPLPPGVEGPLWVHRDAGGRPRPRYVLGQVLALAAAKAEARARRAQHATDPEGHAA